MKRGLMVGLLIISIFIVGCVEESLDKVEEKIGDEFSAGVKEKYLEFLTLLPF